jgi:hypothetical protein
MEEHHSRDLQRDIVFGNDVLGRHIHRNHPGIEPVHALDAGDEEGDPRAADRLKFPQAQDDPALPFAQDLDGIGQDNHQDDEYEPDSQHSDVSSMTGATVNFRPSTRREKEGHCGTRAFAFPRKSVQGLACGGVKVIPS